MTIRVATRVSSCDADSTDGRDDRALTIGIWAGRGRVRFSLAGRLDAEGIDQLDSLVGLVVRTEVPLVIDCRGLTSVDGEGAAALERCADLATAVRGLPCLQPPAGDRRNAEAGPGKPHA